MDSGLTLPILLAIAEIFGLLAIGGFARKLSYLDDNDIGRWSKMVLDWLYPALIFSSITSGFQAERIGELWTLPLIGFCLPFAWVILGHGLLYGLGTRDDVKKRTFLFFCVVNNYAYLPVVIVQNIWGNGPALANIFFLNIGSTIATWTIGVGVLGGSDFKGMVRNMVSPNLIATLVAVIAAVTGWHHYFPTVVGHVIDKAGAGAVPVLIVLSGASLFRWSSLGLSWQVVYVAIVRLGILPIVTILALKFLPMSQDIYNIAVIIALMPLGVSAPIFARLYKGDSVMAANCSFITTVVSIATIPVSLWIIFGK